LKELISWLSQIAGKRRRPAIPLATTYLQRYRDKNAISMPYIENIVE
jgi:hypothetical protein